VAFLFTSILISGYYLSKARITAKVRQVGLTIQFPQQVWSSCVIAAAYADYRLDGLLESAKPEARKR
jgi:hypothetical protein